MDGMVKMLADLFELKIPNPVVDFWFCGKDAMDDGTAEKPSDFEQYKLIEEKAEAERLGLEVMYYRTIGGKK